MAIRTLKALSYSPRAPLAAAFWTAAAAAAVVGFPLAASAQVTIKFPTVVPANNTVPDGPAPWLTAIINDIATDVVSITLTPNFPASTTIDNQDFISQVSFKLNYFVSPNSILPAFSALTSPPDSTNANQFVAGSYLSTPPAGDCTKSGTFFCGFGQDGINNTQFNPTTSSAEGLEFITGPAGLFDFSLILPPNPGSPANTLGAGDSATFYVKGGGLTASAFNVERNAEGYTACAKVQGIGAGSEGSSVICDGVHIPKVPGPLPVLGAAAAFGYSRRIRARIQGSRQQSAIS